MDFQNEKKRMKRNLVRKHKINNDLERTHIDLQTRVKRIKSRSEVKGTKQVELNLNQIV